MVRYQARREEEGGPGEGVKRLGFTFRMRTLPVLVTDLRCIAAFLPFAARKGGKVRPVAQSEAIQITLVCPDLSRARSTCGCAAGKNGFYDTANPGARNRAGVVRSRASWPPCGAPPRRASASCRARSCKRAGRAGGAFGRDRRRGGDFVMAQRTRCGGKGSRT